MPSTPLLGPPESDPEKVPATPRLLVAPARGDTRELLLETLSQISRHPSFMVDLYINYDCDMNCENMFERLIEFAAKVLALSSAAFAMSYCDDRGSIHLRAWVDQTINSRTRNISV